MDNPVLMSKIETLSRCVARIQQKTPADASLLGANMDAQDIIVLNLERAVQICVDMATHVLAKTDEPAPASMVESFNLYSSVGSACRV